MFFLVVKLGICKESCDIFVSAPPAIHVIKLKAKRAFSEEGLICSRKHVNPKSLKGCVVGCGSQVLPICSCLGHWIVLTGICISFMLQSWYDLFLVLGIFLSPPLTQIFFLELPVFPLSPFSSFCPCHALIACWQLYHQTDHTFNLWSGGTCLTEAGNCNFTVTKARARRNLGNS